MKERLSWAKEKQEEWLKVAWENVISLDSRYVNNRQLSRYVWKSETEH